MSTLYSVQTKGIINKIGALLPTTGANLVEELEQSIEEDFEVVYDEAYEEGYDQGSADTY